MVQSTSDMRYAYWSRDCPFQLKHTLAGIYSTICASQFSVPIYLGLMKAFIVRRCWGTNTIPTCYGEFKIFLYDVYLLISQSIVWDMYNEIAPVNKALMNCGRICQTGWRGPSILTGLELWSRTLQASEGRGSTCHRGRPAVSRMWSILSSGVSGCIQRGATLRIWLGSALLPSTLHYCFPPPPP